MQTSMVFFIILFGLIGVWYLFKIISLSKKRPTKTNIKIKFFQSLTIGLKKNLVDDLDSVVDIYKGISLVNEEEDYRNNLSLLLRQYLVEIISKKRDTNKTVEKYNTDVAKKLSGFIKLNEDLSPYADLPLEERTIFNDITIFLDKKDMDSVRRKILELQGTIKARNDDLERIRNINNLTVPLAIVSIILTVFFGLMAWGTSSISTLLQRLFP
ncbi:MAG: hypothetical protein KAH01_06850 [Caldisericia bacterium]|nr:hypothetical protein [Caldisericia bacterium]